MFSYSVSLPVFICGAIVLVLDSFILIIGCLWWRRRKWRRNPKDKQDGGPGYIPLLTPISSPPITTTSVKAQIDNNNEFKIPRLIAVNRSLSEERSSGNVYDLASVISASYPHKSKSRQLKISGADVYSDGNFYSPNSKDRKLRSDAFRGSGNAIPLDSGLDLQQYYAMQKRSIKGKPKLSFEFYYDFRTTQLKVNLHSMCNIDR